MFGVGFSEIIVIAIFALIFVGPKRLPEMAKEAGKLFVKFKRMTSDVRSTVDDFLRQAEEEIRSEEREALLKVLGGAPAPSNSNAPQPVSFDDHHNGLSAESQTHSASTEPSSPSPESSRGETSLASGADALRTTNPATEQPLTRDPHADIR